VKNITKSTKGNVQDHDLSGDIKVFDVSVTATRPQLRLHLIMILNYINYDKLTVYLRTPYKNLG
jgi:hypothetical protein